MTTWPGNLAAYSAQVAALVAVGVLLPLALRVRQPRVLLACWQTLLAAVVLLPLLQPWGRVEPVGTAEAIANTVQVTAMTAAGTPLGVSIAQAVAACLVTGSLVRLGWLLAGLLRLRRARQASTPLQPLPSALEDVRARLGVRAGLHVSADGEGPLTFGLRRPVVLLPRGVLEMPVAQQRAVVCHELLHVRRRDWLFVLLEEAVRTVLWFHPAIWWLSARIALAREQTVDHDVVRLIGSRRAYLDALLRIASTCPPRLEPATALHRRHDLHRRVGLILREVSMSTTRLVISIGLITLALAAAGRTAVTAFPLQAAPADPATGPAAQAPTRLAKDTKPPKKIKDVAPAYPADAKAQGIQGIVLLDITVDETGTVTSVEPRQGHRLLQDAAVEAVKQWTFERPALAPVLMTVTINFKLADDEAKEDGSMPAAPGGPGEAAASGQQLSPVKEVRPAYPAVAKADKVTGQVIVDVTVDAKGRVTDAAAVSGPDALREAALTAARQWEFAPPGVAVKTTLEFQFVLK